MPLELSTAFVRELPGLAVPAPVCRLPLMSHKLASYVHIYDYNLLHIVKVINKTRQNYCKQGMISSGAGLAQFIGIQLNTHYLW